MLNEIFFDQIAENFNEKQNLIFSATSATSVLIDGGSSRRTKMRFVLSRRNSSDNLGINSLAIYQGTVTYLNSINGESQNATAILNLFKSETGKLDFDLVYQDPRNQSFNFLSSGIIDVKFLNQRLRTSSKIIRSLEMQNIPKGKCGFDQHSDTAIEDKVHNSLSARSEITRGKKLRSLPNGLLQLEVIFDSEWEKIFLADSVKTISSIISSAEVAYKRDLGISFFVKKITDSQLLTESSNLPEIYSSLFSYNKNISTDLVHFFSGKQMAGMYGAAYSLGTVCRKPDQSVSFTLHHTIAEDIFTFMHEVGHNLGATHVASNPATIMYPGAVANMLTEFHQTSKTEVNNFLSSYGSCVNYISGDVAFTPDNLKLSAYSVPISKSNFEIKGLVKQSEIPIPNVTVQLLYRQKQGQIKKVIQESKTLANGWVQFIVKKRGRYRLRLASDSKQLSPIFRKK